MNSSSKFQHHPLMASEEMIIDYALQIKPFVAMATNQIQRIGQK